MEWNTVMTVVGGLGGLELLKWIWSTVANRRNDARKADSEADASEFTVLKGTTEFLQRQLDDKERRFADQTSLVRQLNRDLLGMEREKAQLEIELLRVRCDDAACPFRQPPNAYTPPAAGMARDDFFEKIKTEQL